jgi:hypothetical protein
MLTYRQYLRKYEPYRNKLMNGLNKHQLAYYYVCVANNLPVFLEGSNYMDYKKSGICEGNEEQINSLLLDPNVTKLQLADGIIYLLIQQEVQSPKEKEKESKEKTLKSKMHREYMKKYGKYIKKLMNGLNKHQLAYYYVCVSNNLPVFLEGSNYMDYKRSGICKGNEKEINSLLLNPQVTKQYLAEGIVSLLVQKEVNKEVNKEVRPVVGVPVVGVPVGSSESSKYNNMSKQDIQNELKRLNLLQRMLKE